MDQHERYFWDLTGYLVVPGVLTAEEIDERGGAGGDVWAVFGARA